MDQKSDMADVVTEVERRVDVRVNVPQPTATAAPSDFNAGIDAAIKILQKARDDKHYAKSGDAITYLQDYVNQLERCKR